MAVVLLSEKARQAPHVDAPRGPRDRAVPQPGPLGIGECGGEPRRDSEDDASVIVPAGEAAARVGVFAGSSGLVGAAGDQQGGHWRLTVRDTPATIVVARIQPVMIRAYDSH
ncbi:hypothetical protein AB0A94_13350 [Streptomyces sp. NPDC044984]|uniref:hypothetical protein n=1 Tax=Streptomyces sp. NPDC044984 TaxID=3154335 RepID=UPI003407BE80